MKLMNIILTAIVLIALIVNPATAFAVKAISRDYATDANLNPSVITINGIAQIANPNSYFNNVPENQIVHMTNEVAGYQTDTDDLYFDSNLRTCTGETCDLTSGISGYEFVTHCDADQGNTWNCKVTNNNQDLFFLYFSANDGVFVVNRLVANSAGNNPVLYNLPDVVFDEDESFTLMLDNYVIDADDPDSTLTWTYSGNSDVSIVINPVTHVAVFTASHETTETITFTVSDNEGHTASDSITVIVNDVDGNQESDPVITNLPDITFEIGDTRTLILDNYVSDLDDPDLTLTWTYSGNNHVNIVVNAITHIATFTASQECTETITFTVSDNEGNTDSDSIVITVNEEDDDEDEDDEESNDEEVHNLNIADLTINKNEVKCGDQITLTVKLENTGDYDEEDASITVKSDKLKLMKTQLFDLDQDDDTTLSFTFTVPNNVASGRYFFEAIINFDNDDLTKNEFINFNVKCDSKEEVEELVEPIIIEEQPKEKISWPFIIFMLLLNLVLLLGIGYVIKKIRA